MIEIRPDNIFQNGKYLIKKAKSKAQTQQMNW